ncbi:MAG: HTH-type transcriptional regulator/antitoxin HigA [Thermoproteota archaeon]|jgi:HTH-type transcriptional regulator/antitoxin HigA
MKKVKIENRVDYTEVMTRIEKLLKKSTESGSFQNLTNKEKGDLSSLSILAEEYEDSIPLMPIKVPATITEMIRYKMFEMNLRQKQLATLLEISEARISELLNGKRKLNIELAKKLHSKLNIDAAFLLQAS